METKIENPLNIMGTLYVTRHGETDCNHSGLLMGRNNDAGLNENGMLQAHELGKKVRGLDIDAIVSSPLLRAHETAEIINNYIHKVIELDPRLEERNIGVYEGLTLKEVHEKYQKGYDSDMAYNKTPPGGESSEEVRKRVSAAIGDVIKKYPDKKVLIVAHSFIIRMINKYFHPNISADDFFEFTLKNVEIREFTF